MFSDQYRQTPARAISKRGANRPGFSALYSSGLCRRRRATSRRHSVLPVDRWRRLMPQWLTRWESLSCARTKWPASNRNAGRLRFGTVAGFKSEWRPASSRYRGRLRVGIPGRIKSESAHLALPACWRLTPRTSGSPDCKGCLSSNSAHGLHHRAESKVRRC